MADFLRNLGAGFRLLAMRASGEAGLRVSIGQLVALLLAPMLLRIGAEYVRIGADSDVSAAGLASLVQGVPWLLVAAWACARAVGAEDRALRSAVALAALWLAVSITWNLLSLVPPHFWNGLGDAAMVLWWAPYALGMAASVPALVRSTTMAAEHRVAAILSVVGLLALPSLLLRDDHWVWQAHRDEGTAAADQSRWLAATGESMLYEQSRLLDQALNAVKPGRPGIPEIFLLALAGHGAQDVFLREVRAVEEQFRGQFDTAGHSVVLVNNPSTLDRIPVASVTALAHSLRRIGERMNRDEDVLFLFMTSHGSPDHHFDLSLWPYRFDELTPQRLRRMIDDAGIRYKVVLVSACYSGGFVGPLADDDTLVITAAAQDRNSHGCSHEADWTFFGRAFFQEALTKTHSVEAAFAEAQAAVAKREAAEGYLASQPQIAVGSHIRPVLHRIEQRTRAPS